MSSSDWLESQLEEWLRSTPHAEAAAQLLVKKSAATGALPAALTLPADDERAEALRALFPEGRYTARRANGRKLVFRIPSYEIDQGLAPGSILEGVASLTNRPLENRRQQRDRRQSFLLGQLSPLREAHGLQGEVARRDAIEVEAGRGRWWGLSARAFDTEVTLEIERYWNLLARLEVMSAQMGVLRAVHLSRELSGDTHWFRPGTQPWRWVSEDLAEHLPDCPQQSETLQGSEWHQQVLAHCGVCESLTSVRVLVFGRMELIGEGFCWSWPAEAALEGMPIWLSMAHLQLATLRAKPGVRRVVSVENETTFWDLSERLPHRAETLLVYTEGQANRAVVQALRQLATDSPHLSFAHQGYLDLPGVRIFQSLCQRTGIGIEAERMDPETYLGHLQSGIPLTATEAADIKRELSRARLPLQELLREILKHRRRIEQEALALPSGDIRGIIADR